MTAKLVGPVSIVTLGCDLGREQLGSVEVIEGGEPVQPPRPLPEVRERVGQWLKFGDPTMSPREAYRGSFPSSVPEEFSHYTAASLQRRLRQRVVFDNSQDNCSAARLTGSEKVSLSKQLDALT